MIRFIFAVLIIFTTIQMNTAQTISGEYRLKGVHDAASAFRFTDDGRFEFFFMYGVVDRAATGSYTIEGNTIKLKSDKTPGQDFPITKQNKQGKHYTIQVTDQNTFLLSNIVAIYFVNSQEKRAYSDNQGLITINDPLVDKIFLKHEIFPDIPSLIKDENNNNTHFEVKLSPSLAEVSFKGIDFTIDGDELTCLPNYVLPFQSVVYVKQ